MCASIGMFDAIFKTSKIKYLPGWHMLALKYLRACAHIEMLDAICVPISKCSIRYVCPYQKVRCDMCAHIKFFDAVSYTWSSENIFMSGCCMSGRQRYSF